MVTGYDSLPTLAHAYRHDPAGWAADLLGELRRRGIVHPDPDQGEWDAVGWCEVRGLDPAPLVGAVRAAWSRLPAAERRAILAAAGVTMEVRGDG